jgi:hypothetical protein
MTLLKTPHRAPQSLQNGLASAATPPFHRLPVRRGPFNCLALLSCERERAVGVENGAVVARLDGEIREILTNQVTVDAMVEPLLSGKERTQGKIDRLLRDLGGLIEELATLEGTVHWFAKLGRFPYKPLYPEGLQGGDLVNLREKLLSNDPGGPRRGEAMQVVS